MNKSIRNSILLLLFPLLIWSQNTERNLSSENWQFKKTADANWLPAKVPGTVHTDLYAVKVIPDPFFGANERQLQWIENENWEYQTTFTISKKELNNQHCVLQFDGLDTYAEVFLNGKKILEADNMFRILKTEINDKLKSGPNTLRIVFSSAVKKGKDAAKKLPYTLPGDEKVFTRKAQYQYGWDWGPRFVTCGVWKPVKLVFWNDATISIVKYNQKKLTDAVAKLEFIAIIESVKRQKVQLKINDKMVAVDLKKGKNTITTEYEIVNPKRWWTNGLGESYLYDFTVDLSKNGQKIAQSKLKIGLRTIELIQEKDTIGKSFYFKLNGVPVFMKGANYIPPDSFLPRTNDSIYKAIVKNAVDVNMNMLRVWGGGVYPDDVFYDECDKNGILVWQDFMFACAMYPGDPAFLDNVKNEVVDNVSRLQNHPSIALWCGNNENDEGWKNWGWQKQYHYTPEQEVSIWNDYQKLFHGVIPQTLDSLLTQNENRYWPSSPSIGWGRKESLLEGDSHYWGVWWGMEPFEVYEKKVGRFMSEYGFQGMPDVQTFQAFAVKEDLNFDSEAVKNHQKHPTGYKTITEYMARDYLVPKSFEDFAYVSQLLQADGMKTAIETHRRAKLNCMGTLYWQLNDCWPVTSWSSVDYFGRWKALHYQLKKSFDPVLITVEEAQTGYKIYVVNDDLKKQKGSIEVELLDFNGTTLWKIKDRFETESNSKQLFYEVPKEMIKEKDKQQQLLSLSYSMEGKTVKCLYYFAKPKDLALKKPTVTMQNSNPTTIEITSDVLAKNIFLSDGDVIFSDNYFDLLPNQKVQIQLSKPAKKILFRSLFDTLE